MPRLGHHLSATGKPQLDYADWCGQQAADWCRRMGQTRDKAIRLGFDCNQSTNNTHSPTHTHTCRHTHLAGACSSLTFCRCVACAWSRRRCPVGSSRGRSSLWSPWWMGCATSLRLYFPLHSSALHSSPLSLTRCLSHCLLLVFLAFFLLRFVIGFDLLRVLLQQDLSLSLSHFFSLSFTFSFSRLCFAFTPSSFLLCLFFSTVFVLFIALYSRRSQS